MTTDLTEVGRRFEGAPYNADVGMEVRSLSEGHASIAVPFLKQNSNPGGALHGGVYASVIGTAGALVGASVLPVSEGAEIGTVGLQVSYLAAAIDEEILAEARMLRRGKELVYTDILVSTASGKPVAKGHVVYRIFEVASTAANAERQRRPVADPGAFESGAIIENGEFMATPHFIARRGMTVRRMDDGIAAMEMAHAEHNEDHDGRVHEGALAALMDTTGAMASWSITGLDLGYKASTVSVSVNYHAQVAGEPVVAGARCVARRNELFVNDLVAAGTESGTVAATGTVVYRIVVP